MFFLPTRPQRTGPAILCCEDVAVDKIADGAATPAYVYSGGAVEAAYRRLDRAFGALPHSICYAVKANSNLAILKLLAKLGSSFDIVSGGELDRLHELASMAAESFSRAWEKRATRCAKH